MSVAMDRDVSQRDQGDSENPRIEARTLCAQFVERIVADAQSAASRADPGQSAGEVDWNRIWQAGDGAPSEEAAIGRIIRVASEEARRIAPRGFDERPATSGVARDAGTAHTAMGNLVAPGTTAGSALGEPTTPFAEPEATHRDSELSEAVSDALVEPRTERRDPSPISVAADRPVVADEPRTETEEPGPALATEVRSSIPVVAPDEASPASADVETADLLEPVPVQEWTRQPEPSVAAAEDLPGTAISSRHAGWLTAFTWTRNLGVVILLFVAWQLWGTAIAQHHAQSQLHDEFVAKVQAHKPPAAAGSGHTLIPASTRFPPPANGSVVARLQIPAIGTDQYVVEGTKDENLSQGPGHYTGTALPGQAGNVAIAGHRTTHGAPFNLLGHLVKGDRIILTTTWGERLTYVVAGTPQSVSPNDVAVLNYFGDNRVTLTTCTPEYSAAQRLVVVGQLAEAVKGPKISPPARDLSYHLVDPAGASWDWSLLPGIGIVVCLLLLLGLSYKRFENWFGRIGQWAVLLPLWAAGLYLLFATLTGFIPSDF